MKWPWQWFKKLEPSYEITMTIDNSRFFEGSSFAKGDTADVVYNGEKFKAQVKLVAFTSNYETILYLDRVNND